MERPNRPLKVLLVEDSPEDAELVLRALRELDRPVRSETRRQRGRRCATALARLRAGRRPQRLLDARLQRPGGAGDRARARAGPALHLRVRHDRRGAGDRGDAARRRRLRAQGQPAPPAAGGRARAAHRRASAPSASASQRALRESEERFRTIVESTEDWIWEIDWTPAPSTATARSSTSWATARRSCSAPGPPISCCPKSDRELVIRRLPVLVAACYGWQRWRLRWRHRDGEVRVLESTATPCVDETAS